MVELLKAEAAEATEPPAPPAPAERASETAAPPKPALERSPVVSRTEPADRPAATGSETSRLLDVAEQILKEIRRGTEQGNDFSVPKVLAGIVQIVALATLFFAYLNRETPETLNSILLLAIAVQTLTISLLIMGKQK